MRHPTIEFRGTYRYRSAAHVEHALAAARERIADDDAAAVLETLAATAIDGAVEARHDGRSFDWFASGNDLEG